MAHPGTRVTAEDIVTGESKSVVITNDYVVVCDGRARIAGVQKFANGTVVVTIKHDAEIAP